MGIEKGMHGGCGIGFEVRLARRFASSSKRACLRGRHDMGGRQTGRRARRKTRRDGFFCWSALCGKAFTAIRTCDEGSAIGNNMRDRLHAIDDGRKSVNTRPRAALMQAIAPFVLMAVRARH
ncbi:hypothetical protein [Paraburkholderia unamae]|uniref:hypothetical protein n=1 Tax=Paraburkholderia unamae TaxID=219649 RepID=UPI0015EB286D|nr:hypothetical protein [Paraburkholderia unamae]